MMLTLVLLVGAVSCSPVPSEPSPPASVARHGTAPAGATHEANHELRQVTLEVIEEVGETTLSTTSSELTGEDDPPIPTATTPPVLPESEPQEANSAVTEPHRTPQQQHEAPPHHSHESLLVIQPHESHSIHPHPSLPQSPAIAHHDSQSNGSSSSHQQTNPETIQPHDASSGLPHVSHPQSTAPEVIKSHAANPEASPSHGNSSEDSLPHKITEQDSEPDSKDAPQIPTSEEGPTERSVPSQETSTSQSSELEHSQPPEKHTPHGSSGKSASNESSPRVRGDGAKVQNSRSSEVPHHTLPHHHHHYQEVEVVIEADLHSWESTEHRHFASPIVRGGTENTENTDPGEDLADVAKPGASNVVIRGNDRADNGTVALRGAVREAIMVAHSLEQVKGQITDGKVEYIDTVALSTDTEEDTTDEITPEGPQQGARIQVSIAGERVQHPYEPEGSNGSPPVSDGQTHQPSGSQKEGGETENRERTHTGEMEMVPSLVMDSSSPIDIVERSEEAEKEVLEGAASETAVETLPRERNLRVQDQSETRNGSKMLSGLESMSMTSPTPDETLGGGTQPSEDLEATIVPPETLAENKNSSLTETDDKVEGTEESGDQGPNVASQPTEDYSDNYSDPISTKGLPDLVVTQEELPNKGQHETELPILSTSDKEASGNLRTEGNVAWALPPQEGQVSVVAPDSLTPGCIVAIVFGVIISVSVVLGIGGFVVWQRRALNRPKVLGSDRGYAGSDSGGYIDDQVRVSYVNSQIDSPKGTSGQASQPPQGEQVPKVLIHLRSLKPSLPKGIGKSFQKALPSMPKVAPMNLPTIGQFIPKWESRGSN